MADRHRVRRTIARRRTSSSPTSTATSGASSSRPTAASGSRSGREMVQGNRGDRQAGSLVGLHYHLHQADYWYVPVRAAPGSCCTTCATGSPTDGATLTLDLGAARRRRATTTAASSSRPAWPTASPSLTDMTITYLVDGYYNPADELGVAWDDPDDRRRLGRHRPDPVRPRPDEPAARRPRPAVAAARRPPHLRTPPCKLFVTGGAGFIGSNYVRCVLANTDDEVTVFDALTYAGNLDNLRDLDDDPRFRFVQGRHLRPRRRRRGDGRPRRGRALRGREPRRPLDRRAPTSSCAPTATAPTCCATSPAGSASSASCTSPPTRSTARSRRARSPRPTALGAPLAVLGVEGRLRPHRPRRTTRPTGCRSCVTRSSNNFGPVPVPREGHPAVRHQPARRAARSRSTATGSTCATGASSRTTAPASTSCCAQGDDRRDLQHRRRQRDHQPRAHRRGILGALGADESMIEYVEDRLGHDRRYSIDTAKVRALGWAPRRELDEALDATVAWYRDNRWWWEPLQGRVSAPCGSSSPAPAGSSAASCVARVRRPRRGRASTTPTSTSPTATPVLGADHRAARPTPSCTPAAWTAVDACEADPDRAFAGQRARHPPRRRGRPPRRRPPLLRLDRLRVRRHQGRALRRVGRARTRSRSTAARSSAASASSAPTPPIVRTSWVCGAHGANMVKTDPAPGGRARPLRFVDDQRGPPHLRRRPGRR